MKSLLSNVIQTVTVLTGALLLEADGADLISNGGFESGLSGWTEADQLGSEGTFFLQNGTTSPVLGLSVPAPPEGVTAAMSDGAGPGSHVLYQTFTLTSPTAAATLGFDLFIGNRAEDDQKFYSPDTLDFSTPTLNQQARVDILAAGADPFSVNGGDVLLKLFQTQPGDAPISGYSHFSLDLTSLLNANLNQTLTLRFAEVDNVGPFQLGVDNVSLQTSTESVVPDGSAFMPGLLTMAGMCWAARKRRSA